jgi:hypothetical protein
MGDYNNNTLARRNQSEPRGKLAPIGTNQHSPPQHAVAGFAKSASKAADTDDNHDGPASPVPRINMLKMNVAANALFASPRGAAVGSNNQLDSSSSAVRGSLTDRTPSVSEKFIFTPLTSERLPQLKERPHNYHGGNTELSRIAIPVYSSLEEGNTSLGSPTKKKAWMESIKSDMRNVKKLPEYDRMNSFAAESSKEISISHRKFGDDRLYVFACGLRDNNSTTRYLDISDNRLTDKGFELIFRELNPDNNNGSIPLEIIDISENGIKKRGCEELAKYVASSYLIRMMSMRNMQLENLIAKKFMDRLSSQTLVSLSLAHNHLEDAAAVAVANYIQCTQSSTSRVCALTELDLSWNKIGSNGGIAIINAVRKNNTLTSLDMSWNAMATAGVRNATQAISKHMSTMFEENKALTHLDISNNNFSSFDCATMSTGLKANHTLLGIHITGNGGSMDANGELLPDATPWPLESGHAQSSSISRVIGGCVTGRESWSVRSNCWICGGWREFRFTYTLTETDLSRLLHSSVQPTTNTQSSSTSGHAHLTNTHQGPLFTLIASQVNANSKLIKDLNSPAKRGEIIISESLQTQIEYIKQHEAYIASSWNSKAILDTCIKNIPVYLLTSFDRWVPELMLYADMHFPSYLQAYGLPSLITSEEELNEVLRAVYDMVPQFTFELYRMVPPGR